jgi:hypothetical protein
MRGAISGHGGAETTIRWSVIGGHQTATR